MTPFDNRIKVSCVPILWLNSGATFEDRGQKARNIKENRTKERLNTASRLPVARPSSASAKHFLFALWGKRPVVSSQWKAPRYGGFFAALFWQNPPYYISIRKTWRKAASTTCGRGCSTFPQKGTLSAKNYPNGGFSGTSPPPGRDFPEKIGRTLPFWKNFLAFCGGLLH